MHFPGVHVRRDERQYTRETPETTDDNAKEEIDSPPEVQSARNVGQGKMQKSRSNERQ
jgi:hypothetical protein